MLYAIIGEDASDSLEKRLAVRPLHLQRVQELKDQGRLIIAGPFPAIDANDPGSAGFTGSLIIAEFDSLNEAREWADNDPYCSAGVYNSVQVKPYKKVLP